jgi:hypothetical protein
MSAFPLKPPKKTNSLLPTTGSAGPRPGRLVDLVVALKRAGVGYAAIDHYESWPNLWFKDVGGGA